MKETGSPDIVPRQKIGKETNTQYKLDLGSRDEARKIFEAAADRLLDVNRWEKLCGIATANFKLTDQNGNEIERHAAQGDYFKIDIPGPGTMTGKGYDWVRIEKIQKSHDPAKDMESLAMRVRPARNPKTPEKKVAHFFNEHATSSFIVERQSGSVKAGVYGRNETPNTVIGNLIDKIRNFIVGLSALAGISSVQWQNLSKGLIEGEKKK
jgi:hypothetical protein